MEEKRNIKIQNLFWYFIIFSILGLIIETTYNYVTVGVLESRKGLIWGPFCPVYGVGASILILILNRFNKENYFKLFFYGILIGTIIEYLLSYGMEAILGVRFWDYGYTGKDINGRICTQYSFFWGVLSVIIMKGIKPAIDKAISKIPSKLNNIIEIVLFVFLVIDVVVTGWAVTTYQQRAFKYYYNEPIVEQQSSNFIINIKNTIENKYFTNERMKAVFPNLRVKDKEGNELWVSTMVP